MLLDDGIKALQEQNYPEAVKLLEDYCLQSSDCHAPFYIQGKMALARAYRGNNQFHNAIELGQELEAHLDQEVSRWAQGFLSILAAEEKTVGMNKNKIGGKPIEKAARAPQAGVKLALGKMKGNLAHALLRTILLLSGIILAFCLALCLLVNPSSPLLGLTIAVLVTLIGNALLFFLSPWLIDWTQSRLYQTRWVNLAEIKRYSPESAAVIQRVCREKSIQPPKLGIVDDDNPTAFTYGSLPSQARLVVSQGLFTYLDDEEVATVYAHELGHIVHWDFTVMSAASSLIGLLYLFSVMTTRMQQGSQDKFKNLALGVAIAAYIFYQLVTYLILYLSRTREYFADHFAAQTTGNPNGLSRALVKIAAGILEQRKQTEQPSHLLATTRALGIYDPNSAAITGTAYGITSQGRKISQVFLWDLFNPWSAWMEYNSTHPLTGKRLRCLSNYAQQLDLDTEFDLGAVVQEGYKLDRQRLYGSFLLDVLIFSGPIWGAIAGLIAGLLLAYKKAILGLDLLAFILIGLGMGTLLKTLFMYPSLNQASSTDIFSLICDPYASPLRGRPVKLRGKLLGRGEAGYEFGSNMMLQDKTGWIFAHYSSRFGVLGNFLFGWTKVPQLLEQEVRIAGWFRRGVTPWLDWRQMTHDQISLNSYHRLWSIILGIAATASGCLLWLKV